MIVGDINIDSARKWVIINTDLLRDFAACILNNLLILSHAPSTRRVSITCIATSLIELNWSLVMILDFLIIFQFSSCGNMLVKIATRIQYCDMKHFKEEEFKQSLQQAPWETAFVFDNVDDIVYAWEEIFNEILLMHIVLGVKSESNKPFRLFG